MKKDLQLALFHRDAWHCRFCLEPVLFSPTLRLLDGLAPGHGYYHPGSRKGESVDALTQRHAMALHRVSTKNGGAEALDNLDTACWSCVQRKPAPGEVRDVPAELRALNWDGCAAVYRHLPGAENDWVKALGRAAEAAGPTPRGT